MNFSTDALFFSLFFYSLCLLLAHIYATKMIIITYKIQITDYATAEAAAATAAATPTHRAQR